MNGLTSGLGLTCNWVAERPIRTRGYSYYSQLIDDCVDQLHNGGIAYCFTSQQADDIERRIDHAVIRRTTDVGFVIRLR